MQDSLTCLCIDECTQFLEKYDFSESHHGILYFVVMLHPFRDPLSVQEDMPIIAPELILSFVLPYISLPDKEI